MINRFLAFFVLFSSIILAQNDINNRFMLANSFEQEGEYEKAKNILEDIYKRQPENYQFFDALNRMYIQLKNYTASEKIIRERISASPGDPNLYGLLGKTYHLKGDEPAAYNAWDQGLRLTGSNLSVYRLMANYAVERRAFAKAIEILNQGKKLSSDPKLFSYDLANLYSITMDYVHAAEEYIAILKADPNESGGIQSRISPLTNKPDALRQTIKVFEENSGNNAAVRSMLAWLYTEDKRFDAAYRIFSELDEQRGSQGTDIYNYAQLLYSKGEFETASKVYSDIINKHPGTPLINAARMGFAKTSEELLNIKLSSSDGWKPIRRSESRNTGEAEKLINTYIDLSKVKISTGNIDITNEASFRAAGIYLHLMNDPQKAEEIYRRILENYPMSAYAASSAIELGNIYLKNGKTDDAIKILQRGLTLPRISEDEKNGAKLLTARIYFFKKDFESSQKLISQILSNLKDNNANDAIELSLVLNTKMNDSLSILNFADAEYLVQQEKFMDARDKYALISSEKAGFLIGSLARLREAETEIALDNVSKSMELLEKITADESRNIYADKALYLMGNILEYTLNKPQEAVIVYEKLLAKYPSSMYLDEAREHIINLRNKLS